jgi:RHS repeat-associated protein
LCIDKYLNYQTLKRTRNPRAGYFHPDHLGSSTFLTDANGNPYQFLLYLPFGETLAEQKSGGFSTQYRFNGKEQDQMTGLYNYGARFYDPIVSGWLSVDPLTEKYPGWSAYNYVMNNPVRLIDPTGMGPEGGPGDPPMPSAAGILYETYLNADKAVFNFMAKGLEWAGFGKPGVNLRKEPVFNEYGGHIDNKIVERPEGTWGEAFRESVGDGLALWPMGGGAKGISGPVFAVKTPILKNGAVKFLKKDELAKRLNTNVDDYHDNIKKQMKSEHKVEMKKLGTTNPDFTPNDAGKLDLRNPKTGKTITTNTDFVKYRRAEND